MQIIGEVRSKMNKAIRNGVILSLGLLMSIAAAFSRPTPVMAGSCPTDSACWNSGMAFNGKCGEGGLFGGPCDCTNGGENGGACTGQPPE